MGKVREPYLTDGISDYLKRLRPFANLEIVDLPDEKVPDRASDAEIRKLTEKEGLRMLNAVNPDDSVIALDVSGTEWSSIDLARYIGERELSVQGDIVFCIGGSLGLSDAVIRRAGIRLSLSRMTFTHQMVRLILLEQIYRAFMIHSGRPYHR
jgi:23S rRNA (pseudouridine1915-N3)-methyltransferase